MKKVFIPNPIHKDLSSFSMIPNVWFDEVQNELKASEWEVLSVFLRKTYGFNQEEVRVSQRYICIKTGLSRTTVIKAIDGLLQKKYLYRIEVGKGTGNKFQQVEENASLYKLVTGYQRDFDDSYIDEQIEGFMKGL